MKCKCGKELSTGDLNGMCLECFNNQNTGISESPPAGWICPKCGSVWAPRVDGCEYCNGPQLNPEIMNIKGERNVDKTRP